MVTDNRLIQILTRNKLWWLFLIAAFLFFGLNYTVLLSRWYLNLGLQQLVPVLIAPGETNVQNAINAERSLRQALIYEDGNQSAGRGLGFALAEQGRDSEAIATWQGVSGLTEEFLLRGEQTRNAGQYQDALLWYKRVIGINPELGDAWYGLGLTYEGMNQLGEALEAYKKVGESSVFFDIGYSSPYYRQGMIYQWQENPRQLESALIAYERAIEIDDFSDNLEAAICHYQRGEVLRWIGGNPDEYIAEYQQAINLNPDITSAYVYLGVAYYTRYGDVVKAETEIQKALVLEPNHQWAYYQLGEIYRQEGLIDEAILMYEKSLLIAPDFEVALKRLSLLTNNQ